MNRINSGDALIYCQVSGRQAAPAIVWLHGNGEDLHLFDRQIEYFSKDYKMVAMDTRGHGQSTRGTAPFTFYTFAADLIAVLDALHIKKAHIVGFSDGAITALHTALMAPERVASMVLIGANYHTGGLRWKPRILILFTYIGLSLASLFSAKKRKRREIWGLMVHQPNLSIGALSKIDIPTLVMTGQNDLVSQRHNDEMSRAIAGSQRVIIPDGNHFWMSKRPDELYRHLTPFLQRITATI